MRHDEHPRSLADLLALLSPDEAVSWTTYMRERGFDPTETEPCDLERLYQEWRVRG